MRIRTLSAWGSLAIGMFVGCAAPPSSPPATPAEAQKTSENCPPSAAAPECVTPPASHTPENATAQTGPTEEVAQTPPAPAPPAGPTAQVTGKWTLPERETWVAYQQDAKDWADETQKKCGMKLSGSWNAESFRGHMPDKDRWSRQACGRAFETLQEICGQGDMQKKAVQARFSSGSVECKWSAKKGGGLELNGSKIVLLIDSEGGFGGPNSNGVIIEMIREKL
jgi:hypothetical protein